MVLPATKLTAVVLNFVRFNTAIGLKETIARVINVSVTHLYVLRAPNGIRHHAVAKTVDNVKRSAQKIKNWTKKHANALVLRLRNARKGLLGTKILAHARIRLHLI